jgi:AraC family transcriptional regulator of adaptative response/methylated-DNA-[protein]-cysteine methyltransferase
MPVRSVVSQSARSAVRGANKASARVETGGAAATRGGVEIKYAVDRCSLGAIVVAASEKGVCAILMGDESGALVQDLKERFPEVCLVEAAGSLDRVLAKVVKLVESPSTGLDVPLDTCGTEFQRRVWFALQKIPVGSTTTYTDIAGRIGSPKSVRAVAQACAANPIAVAIRGPAHPCDAKSQQDGISLRRPCPGHEPA